MRLKLVNLLRVSLLFFLGFFISPSLATEVKEQNMPQITSIKNLVTLVEEAYESIESRQELITKLYEGVFDTEGFLLNINGPRLLKDICHKPVAEMTEIEIFAILNLMGVETYPKDLIPYLEEQANLRKPIFQFLLGYRYWYYALGVPDNYLKALPLFEEAVAQELPQAQMILAGMYFNGDGVQQNYGRVFELMSKAEEKGNLGVKYTLGCLHYRGCGVQQDYGKALELFLEVADRGFISVLYDLGIMYEKGYGVDSDLTKARDYFLKLAVHGHIGAQNKLDEYVKKILSL